MASEFTRCQVGLMIRKVMKRERPMRTWLGGSEVVPSAWRRSDMTMMIRVKLVIMMRIAGARERTVGRMMICIAEERFSRRERSGSWRVLARSEGAATAGISAAGFAGVGGGGEGGLVIVA